MYKKYNYCYVMLISVIVFIQGCKKDENVITRIPDIMITASTIPEKMIGDVLEINPGVNYEGQQANFTYKWFKYTNSNYDAVLKLISTEKNLKYTTDSLGAMILRFEATNTDTKISSAITLVVNVVSRAERGWYVLKANNEGNTDMDAFLTTAKGDLINRDLIKTLTGNAMNGAPVGLGFTNNYNWLDPSTNNFTNNNSCLIPVSTKETGAYRIKDERLLASTNQLFFDTPPLASRNFDGIISSPGFTVAGNNGQAYTMNNGATAFLPPRIGNYSMSSCYTIAPSSPGNDSYVLSFDQKNESFMGLKYRQADVTYFPDTYLPEKGGVVTTTISSNNLGAKMVFMENTDGTLDTAGSSNGRAYALLRKDGSSNMILTGLNLQEILPVQGGNFSHSIIRSKDDLPAATYPELTSAKLYALNKNSPVLYFASTNRIGMYNIDSKAYKTNFYSFPAGEEISYIKFIDQQYDSPATNNFRNLVVATYQAGKYKIYRFTIAGNMLIPTEKILEGIGKVKSLLYSSPNVNDFMNGIYRYY